MIAPAKASSERPGSRWPQAKRDRNLASVWLHQGHREHRASVQLAVAISLEGVGTRSRVCRGETRRKRYPDGKKT